MVPNPHMVTAKQPASGPRSGKIDHVVIIVKENHCFDNYFGTFPGANGMTMPRSPNPPPRDPDHRHGAWLTRQTTSVRQQFVEADIPASFLMRENSRSATSISPRWRDRRRRTI